MVSPVKAVKSEIKTAKLEVLLRWTCLNCRAGSENKGVCAECGGRMWLEAWVPFSRLRSFPKCYIIHGKRRQKISAYRVSDIYADEAVPKQTETEYASDSRTAK